MKTSNIFSQLISVAFNCNHFDYLSRKNADDNYVKHFTCWNQLQVMMFGQLCNRKSLRYLRSNTNLQNVKDQTPPNGKFPININRPKFYGTLVNKYIN